ncbi:hypothetical protein MHUMG1_05827 [Neofusicoccum parvum]|uniref:Uncharacterized protein n=1 Tax=Neofusicoccum parvum TaxID=310453 RepID=A0ACB5RQP3_9PEZI|nr:hypothetical protein MHUMG1_05827 [Neofusicoccum parvum]
MASNDADMSFDRYLAEIFESGEHSDVILRASDGGKFPAHRVVLCGKSAYFKNCLKHNFKETSTGSFDLNEDYDTLKAVLEFIYCNCYTLPLNSTVEAQVKLHINAFIAADYYTVPNLSSYALDRFHASINDWGNIKTALPDIVKAIYNKENELVKVMKDEILRLIKTRLADLEFDGGFRNLMNEGGSFPLDILYFKNTNNRKPATTATTFKSRCFCCTTVVVVTLPDYQRFLNCPSCYCTVLAKEWRDYKCN